MKINQIVGEHKKGFRAKKYAKKPTNTIAPKKPEPIKPQVPVGPGDKLNESLQTAFDSWMNSEYAPYDDDSGDYNEVFRKALHFAADHLDNRSDSEHLAHKLTNMFHGEDPDTDLDETGEAGQQAFQVQKTGPEGTTLVNPATKVQMQLPPEMSAQMVQDKNDPKQFNLSQQAVTPTAGGQANDKPAGPQMGDTVTLSAPTMGEEGEETTPPIAPEATDGPAVGEESGVFPSRNPGTPAAAQAAQAQQEPAKPVQSAVYPSRNVRESRNADDVLLDQMRTIAGLR